MCLMASDWPSLPIVVEVETISSYGDVQALAPDLLVAVDFDANKFKGGSIISPQRLPKYYSR